jgi:glycosyltransferase involved in cell wall biosynthesis
MCSWHFKPREALGYMGNATDVRSKFNFLSFNGFDQIKRRLGLDPDGPVVGMVGRLTHSKGWKEFFSAAEILKKKYPEVSFVAIGHRDSSRADGIPQQELERLQAENIIKYLGVKPHDEMPTIYGLMDIVVLMSHREGFPRCLVEAAAMGKPLVATDIRGCREAVEHCVNGFLVPVGDHERLAHYLAELLENADLRREMGLASRKKAEADFDQKRLVERTLSVYRQLLVEKTGRPQE